ncbi:MAG: amidophosphoribosyltransferase [Clostridia bacterium]|nr:amidophosphoribosyltransferase [Clostridia bacterium]
MGGFFGVVSKRDAISDVFFGTDYHSHLGTKRGGMAAYDDEIGLQRDIHNIENSPFRTKFANILEEMKGKAAIGCISDTHPQPLLIRSRIGTYGICIIGHINNSEELIEEYELTNGGHFGVMTGENVNSVELVASLINKKDSFCEGIRFAQDVIDGTAAIMLLVNDGSIIAARDKLGRLPVIIGKNDDGHSVSFESFAFEKLDYEKIMELGPGEVVKITADSVEQLAKPRDEMKMCAFLWTYYGYSTSDYEGVNVEMMRYKNGKILAKNDKARGVAQDIDYVCGMPDSGTPHAIGYANESDADFARAFIKYTPTWMRSFTPTLQTERNKIAKMKQIPIKELIKDKKLLIVDDSIVRGTQLKGTVDFLLGNGAKAVHMRSACPPIMYSCKYLNFSRATSSLELIARRTILELEGEKGFEYIEEYSSPDTERGKNLRKAIAEKFHFDSLEFQSLEGIIEAIGIEPCKLCTYCWTGKE